MTQTNQMPPVDAAVTAAQLGQHRAAGPARPPAGPGSGPGLDPGLDPKVLRRVFGRFATGITVVTTGRDEPRGMTANSFTSVSLDPPLALVCVLRGASMHQAILDTGSFAVSVLAAHQEDAARHFADRGRVRGEQEFTVIGSVPGPRTGAPMLAGALAWLECGLAAVYEGGDHSIFLGEVVGLGHGDCEDALLFYGGGFHRLEPAAAAPRGGAEH